MAMAAIQAAREATIRVAEICVLMNVSPGFWPRSPESLPYRNPFNSTTLALLAARMMFSDAKRMIFYRNRTLPA
jgi:hypothetical protein